MVCRKETGEPTQTLPKSCISRLLLHSQLLQEFRPRCHATAINVTRAVYHNGHRGTGSRAPPPRADGEKNRRFIGPLATHRPTCNYSIRYKRDGFQREARLRRTCRLRHERVMSFSPQFSCCRARWHHCIRLRDANPSTEATRLITFANIINAS